MSPLQDYSALSSAAHSAVRFCNSIMAVYMAKMMKRKDIEYHSDDFSLFSPATKIRRLDAYHPPIIGEDVPDFPSWIRNPAANVGVDNLASNIRRTGSSSQVMVDMPATSENVDRSIVLSNPTTTPLPLSPSRFSIDSDILSGIKKDIHRSNHSILVKSAEDQEEEGRKNARCLAVIPWNPPLQQFPFTTAGNMQGAMSELVEDDQQIGEATTMDIEEDNTATEYSQQQQYSQMNENLIQWQLQQQQHHCMMIQQAPQSSSAPPLMQYQWW